MGELRSLLNSGDRSKAAAPMGCSSMRTCPPYTMLRNELWIVPNIGG